MRSIEPHHPPAPAEAGDAQFLGIGLAGFVQIGDGGVEVGQDVGIGHLADDRPHDLDLVGDLADVSLAGEQIRADGVIAELGQAPRHILHLFVGAEHVMRDDDRRKFSALGRIGAISGDRAAGDGNLDLLGDQAVAVGMDGRHHRQGGPGGDRQQSGGRGQEQVAATEIGLLGHWTFLPFLEPEWCSPPL